VEIVASNSLAKENPMAEDVVAELQKKVQLYEAVLQSIRNGIIITDPDGMVLFFSEAYGKFLKMDTQSKIGKHCTEVIENTRMHIVAQTGVAEINHPHWIQGRDMVVQRIPIRIDGKLAAVFGQVMFGDVKDVQSLASKLNVLESKVKLYEKELVSLRSSKYSCKNILGKSSLINELKELAGKAAGINAPVLLTGESGTGKELFAHAIHHGSERKLFPFIRLNCAAIPKDLLESELFGYEAGAFTGAGSKGKPGKFELAHQGTVFLDEISELPLEMQPKLLRVLEEKELERLGSTKLIKCDFRLIAATHENLEDLVAEGKFRRDLFYRLNVIPLHLPSLKNRKEDIAVLAEHFVQAISKDFSIPVRRISPSVMRLFEQYSWPGNIRELSNILERILYSMDPTESVIDIQHLPLFLRSTTPETTHTDRSNLKNLRENSEKVALINAINLAKNNKNKAASLLGIHRTALYKKMKKFHIPLQAP
jgi:transcriptional regulator with PAS, ATPase and Fis domain